MMYVEATPTHVTTSPGGSVTVTVTITNTTSVIDAYTIRTFGLDSQWVDVSPPRLSLFPAETRGIDLTIALPPGFPAGPQHVAIQVQSSNDPTEFSFTHVSLDVGAHEQTSVRVDPTTITGGSAAQFSLIVVNDGNATIEARPEGVDPEDIASIAFEPAVVVVPPKHREVITADVRGGRPWVGQPTARVLQFSVTGSPPAVATFVQRPRVGRLLIALLGLITVAAVFAAVLSRVLDDVVEEAGVDDELLNEALDERSDEVQSVPVDPATITGSAVLTGSGAGVAGMQAELYTADNGEVPIGSAATDPDGTFTFGGLSPGSFRIRLTGAGFDPTWYAGASTFSDATDVTVEPGKAVEIDELQLVGQPGAVSGVVALDDPTGTTARLVAAGAADPDTPGLVSEVDVSADGTFLFEEVPSPAVYQLIVEKPGFTTEVRDVVLRPAQEADGIEVALREGGGSITGHVESPSGPLGGVTVTATDGDTTISTVSLTRDDIGFFAVRGLPTPGRYTVTFERRGFATQTRTVELGSTQEMSGTSATLAPTTGAVSGVVRHGDEPIGGVTVAITGGDVEMTTTTASQGEPGSYLFQRLPAPATYTITFSKDGFESQSRLEHLDPATGERELTGIDVSLVSSTAVVRGVIRDADGTPIGGASITLSDGSEERALRTAHEPRGRFEFDDVAPGSYTFSAELPGSEPEVVLVNVLPADVEELDVSLGEQATLTGRVLVRNAEIGKLVPYSDVIVRLFRVDDFPGTATAAVATATADGDGRYTFTDLPAPDDFVVAVYATDSSSDALDSVLVRTVPSDSVDVPPFELQEES